MAALQDDTALGEAVLRGWLDADLAERRLGEALRSASLLVERLVKRGADDEAAALAATVDRQLRPALLRLRAPGSRNALLRDLHALHALRSGRWQAGPVEASLAETLLAALDGLVPSSASTAEGDGVLLELERRIGDELLGTERSGGVTERDRVVLAVDLAWSNAGNSAGAALWQPRSGAVVVQPVMQRDRGGLLVGRDGGWRWIPVDLPTLRATRNELHALIAQGHAEQSTLDVLLTRLATALAAPQWLSGRNEVFIVAHAEFAGLPIEWLRQAITGEASRISWLHRLRGAQTLQPRQLAILGAAADRSHALASLAEVADETSSVRAIWNDLLPTTQGVSRDALHDALTIPGALVHVAAHGRSADWREEEAGLWMQDAVGRPAFVSALRLRRSNVASAVVVLSACDTGYSAAGAAFGFGGVASALVEAGAGAVIATRWPVGDRSARLFAEHFHRALRDSPTELEAALALAVEALRRAPATRHPTHWAGWFVLRREPPETRGVNDAAP